MFRVQGSGVQGLEFKSFEPLFFASAFLSPGFG